MDNVPLAQAFTMECMTAADDIAWMKAFSRVSVVMVTGDVVTRAIIQEHHK